MVPPATEGLDLIPTRKMALTTWLEFAEWGIKKMKTKWEA
jgi:hypothetical protein